MADPLRPELRSSSGELVTPSYSPQEAEEEQTVGERLAYGPQGVMPSYDELLREAEDEQPTATEMISSHFGGAPVRRAEGFLEVPALAATRGVGAVFSDTNPGRIRAMDTFVRIFKPDHRVIPDPETGRPILRQPDGTLVPLDLPGFAEGTGEMMGELGEAEGMGAFAQAGAVIGAGTAAATLGPGAIPLGSLAGAVTFEGLRQLVQELTGMDDESASQMFTQIGVEGTGRLLPIIFPKLLRRIGNLSGGKLAPGAEEALKAQERLKVSSKFDYGLTTGELATGPIARMARQVNILSSYAQAVFAGRGPRLVAMLSELPDPLVRGQLRSFVERDFQQELRLQQQAMLEAARVTVKDDAAYRGLRKTWQDMFVSQRRNSQIEVAAAYDDADRLMANAGLREDYFFTGSKGDEISDEIARIRSEGSGGTPIHKDLREILKQLSDDFGRAQARGVRGMLDKQMRAQSPLTGEMFQRTKSVRTQLQDYAEQLYDVASNESVPGWSRGQAKVLRAKILAALEKPLLSPIEGRQYDFSMAEEAIEMHQTARNMAKARFDHLEHLEQLGLTEHNPRPIEMIEGLVNAKTPDDVLALEWVHGGLEMARDTYFSQLIRNPETMGKKILDVRPENLLTALGGDRGAFQRVIQTATEIENMAKTGAWQALRRQTREASFAREMLFGEQSAARDAFLEKIRRRGGFNSAIGRSAESGVVEELLSRSLNDAVAGVDLRPEVFKTQLAKLESEGVLDFVSPRIREILKDSQTLASFANMARPDSGSSLEAASTVARLRTGRFFSALTELGVAEGLAMLLTSPKATQYFAAAVRMHDPSTVLSLVAGSAVAMGERAIARDLMGENERAPGGPEPAGVE